MTQEELAKMLGITRDSISLWETGKRIPVTQYLVPLCNIFEISIDYLLGRTDELSAVVMPGTVQLTDEERKILKQYHALRPDLKEIFWITLNALGGSSAPASTKKKA